jgi:alkanesulfonate monooxygenase SsuD/methylene tetrahydromethanopterin reductase-like flavin-dependent oxidoreductase (luciferase family)
MCSLAGGSNSALEPDGTTTDAVDFVGDYYRINNMEALPRCVQRPNPPIVVGAGSPRMLDLAPDRSLD